jgi:hypothetical protein
VYQDRLTVVKRRLDRLNDAMTRDRTNRDRVPALAHVKVLEASLAVESAIQLCTDADAAIDAREAVFGADQ